MSAQKFASIFKSLAVRSMDRNFVLQSLKQQLDVAKSLRRYDNRPRLIHSKNFVPVKTICIRGVPVLEDNQGVQAYFNDAAQLTFSAQYYYGLVNKDIEIVMQHDNVVLLPLPSFNLSCSESNLATI